MKQGERLAKVLKFERRKPRNGFRLHVLPPSLSHARPATRGDCLVCPECQAWRDDGTERTCGHGDDEAIRRSRPCIFVGCRHSLYLEVTVGRSVRFTFPELEPDEVTTASCALDFVGFEPSLEAIGRVLNTTRERVRQVEERALSKVEPLLETVKEEFGV